MKKAIIILSAVILSTAICVHANYDTSFMSGDAWMVLIDCVEEFESESGMRFDSSTSAEDILSNFIFGAFQYYYLENEDVSYYISSYDDPSPEPKNLFDGMYRKYYGNYIDSILHFVFNVSWEEIDKIHNCGKVWSPQYDPEQPNLYYYEGFYYTREGGADGYYSLSLTDYAVLSESNGIYKLKLTLQWIDMDDIYYSGPFDRYCLIRPSEGKNYFTIYGISDNPNNVGSSSMAGIKIVLNGNELSFGQDPFVLNNRVMVPMRAIFEKLGYDVGWTAQPPSASGWKEACPNIDVPIGANGIYVNNKFVPFDVENIVVNGSTFVPVRAIAEGSGATVWWDENNRTVYIEYII